MKQKILILNYEFPPLGGGAANATYHLLLEFAQHPSLEITLITSSVDTFHQEQFATNITIYYLDIGKHNKNKHHQSIKDLLLYSWRSYWFAKNLLKHNTFDCIHAFFGIPCGYIAMKLKNIFKIPYIVSLRGSDVPFYSKKFFVLDRLFFTRLSKKIWHYSEGVYANSEGLKSLAQQSIAQQQIKVIPNGVDLPHPLAPQQDTQWFTILYVGRLIERKGVQELIQGFIAFAQGKLNVRLWIVGGGKDYDKLHHLAQNHKNIHFFGEIAHDDVRGFYAKSDIYILPSKNEGMSNTLLEAMAAGLPILVTDTGGTQELFCDNGWLIKLDQIKNYLDIAYHTWKENKLVCLGHKSRDKVQSMSWSSIAQQYMKVYTNK